MRRRGWLYETAPEPERSKTVAVLREAGWTVPPRMTESWRRDTPISEVTGVAQSTLTRRQIADADEHPERLHEIAAAYGLDLDAPDVQSVRLAYLDPEASEETIEEFVDRQYGTGRIAAGYYLTSAHRRSGRPRTSRTPVTVRLDDDVLDRVDAAAERAGLGRIEWIRQVVDEALAEPEPTY